MKKLIVVLTMLLGIFTTFSLNNVSASVEDAGVEINKDTFPDNYIRRYAEIVADTNQDGILQYDEINRIEMFKVDFEGEGNYPFVSKTIDLKGLEIFTNMKILEVSPKQGKGCYINNISVINNLHKLEKIKLTYCNRKLKLDMTNFPELEEFELSHIKGKTKLDFSENSKLEMLKIRELDNLNKIKLTGNPKLSYFSVYRVKGNAVINLSELKNLRAFEGSAINVKGIKFGKLKKLTRVQLGYVYDNDSEKIKKLDFSGLKNLKKLYICNFTNVKKINIGKNNKLEDIFINTCNKLKNIDLSGCKNINSITVSGSGLKKLKLSHKQEIGFLMITRNKIKKLDLSGMSVNKLYLEENPIKQVDVSGIKEISYVRIPKKTKVIKGKKQQIKIKRYERKNK